MALAGSLEREGIREIAHTFHHIRRNIRDILCDSSEPGSYPKRKTQVSPTLEPFHKAIHNIFKEDETSPPKQHHMINANLQTASI